jgi:5-methylcytosine-specific restriction endonuclease McrA
VGKGRPPRKRRTRYTWGANNRTVKCHVAARDGAYCAWCSVALDPVKPDASIDHVVPQAYDGDDHIDNLLLACIPCNSRRKHRNAMTWLDECRRLDLAVREEVVMQAIARAGRLYLRQHTEG